MKTVCKKLFSLMLVALMLVSALPFAAMAAEGDKTVNVVVYAPDGTEKNGTFTFAGASAKLGAIIDAALPNWATYGLTSEEDESNEIEAYNANGTRVEGGNGGVDIAADTAASTIYVVLKAAAGNDQGPALFDVNVAFVNRKTDAGIGSGTTVEDVVAGGTVDLSALVPNGYTFKSVNINGSISANATITVNGAMSVTVYVDPVSTDVDDPTDDDDDDTNNGGEPQPDQTVGKVNLTIKYNLAGYVDKTVKATKYDLYKEYVGVPERGGYDFLGWYSESYDDIIDVTKDKIKEDDTISAQWSSAKKFTLTLDENRGEEETVNYGVQVTYGEKIWAKVKDQKPERDGYVFIGWKLNGKIIDENTVWDLPGDGTAYAQWKLESDTEGEAMGGNTATADGKVYLEIYTNGDTATLAKRVDITDLAKDNKITLAEVESVVKKYITAKSGYTLKYEGLFDEETWWWYTRDPETNGAKSITVNRDGDDYVYVMVKNVKVVASDPSNPKTGDGIFAVMSVMMGSGAALVSLNELRKRKMI